MKASGANWKACRKHAEELTDYNRRALEMYRRWKAVGRFPDDELVEWVAGNLLEVEEAFRQHQASAVSEMVLNVLGIRSAF